MRLAASAAVEQVWCVASSTCGYARTHARGWCYAPEDVAACLVLFAKTVVAGVAWRVSARESTGSLWARSIAQQAFIFHSCTHTRDQPRCHTRYHRRDGLLYKSIHGTCVELGSTGKYDGSHAYTFLRPLDVGGARRHVAHPQWL